MKIMIIALFVALGLTLLGSVYTVHEGEQSIITQFGRPVGDPVTEAGLHLKLPWIQKVRTFDKRLLEWDGDPKQVTTKDKKFIQIDTTARWRIRDPLTFLQQMRTELSAQSRLDDILDSAAREAIASHILIESVRSSNRELLREEDLSDDEETAAFGVIEVGRKQLSEEILAKASAEVAGYGIELVDFRIKTINYVDQVRRTVYDRMISEREKIASKTRSEGEGKRSEIDGLRKKRLAEVRSEAYRRAEEVRGKADAEAARIYAEAYATDPEFFAFVESLKAYEEILDDRTLLLLSTESDLLKYLDGGGN